MKKILSAAFLAAGLLSCTTKNETPAAKGEKTTEPIQNPYKATYSSDMTSSSKPEIAQKVLTVWKYFEKNQIDSMLLYYADTVTYEDAAGNYFHGKSSDLLKYAGAHVASLDSMRFDISSWESVHLNDKNEDWVYIWAAERSYAKTGKADTVLMQEQWKVENGKVTYFNQYEKAPPRKH